MYFWNSHPFVRLSIALILGILCFDHFPGIWDRPYFILIAGLGLLSLSIIFSHYRGFYALRVINGCLALFLIFFFGGAFAKHHYHSHASHHYKNLDVPIKGFSGIVTGPVNERTKHFRYDFELNHIISATDSIISCTGKIYLYIGKDSLIYQYGDRLNVYGRFFPVSGPGNPNEFNYKQYLEQQNIFSHAFVKPEDVRYSGQTTPNSFLKLAFLLRASASRTIDENLTNPRERGIAQALLLGIKDHLDNDVKESYSAAGAMHVLAVSGLHVGIIFLVLKLLFGKLKTSGKYGKLVFASLSVILIWLYAAVTGLSPSVLRAATMFSMIAVGDATRREGNIYNSLGMAAFVLLLFDPYLIYSVGFQLSFAAVIGIVYLQPKMYRLLDFRFSLLDKAWSITCVSIAAQLATFPLTAYYFHQFPTYFLASNLVVIPAAFLMLTGGIAMLIIHPIVPDIGRLLGWALQQFMWLINEAISLVHILPQSLIKWIHLDHTGLILSYFIIISFIAGIHYKAFKTLMVSSLLGLVFIAWSMLSHENQSRRRELVFYDLKEKIAVDLIDGHSAHLYVDDFSESEIELLSFQIDPHRLASHLDPIERSILRFEEAGFQKKEVIQQGVIAGRKILIIDSTTFHLDFIQPIVADFVIVQNQSVMSLKWLNDHIKFDQIILGTGNSYYYTKKMKQQAIELGIHIHSLSTEGALVTTLEGIKKERTVQPALFTTNPD